MKKLTILLDDHIYEGLHRVAGKGNVGNFVSEKITPFLIEKKKDAPSAFGILKHLARPYNEAEAAEAAYEYFRDRYAAKNPQNLQNSQMATA
jgi:hypothetical protein